MDRHRDPLFAAEPLREADVVGVPVGEEQGADVGHRPAHRGQLPGDVPVVAGQAGIDDGHLAGLLQEVGVDEALVADAVDAWCDLHWGLLEPAGQVRAQPPTMAGREPTSSARSRATSPAPLPTSRAFERPSA
jgi:hypothetical protein